MVQEAAGPQVAAEYRSRFEADVAVSRLGDAGIRAVVNIDPVIGSGLAGSRGMQSIEVLVDPVDLIDARDVLATTALPPAFRDENLGDWPDRASSKRLLRGPLIGWLLAGMVIVAVVAALSALR